MVRKQTGKVTVVKGKIHPRTAHEVPDGVWTYGFVLSLASALDAGEMVNVTPWPLYPLE
jgi:hypothetical protein